MSTPSKKNDPLLESLLRDGGDLPASAVREARQAADRRTRARRSWGAAAAMAALAIGVFVASHPRRRDEMPVAPPASQVATIPKAVPAEYVLVQTAQEVSTSAPPIPSGVNREQKEVLLAARDLPLLLVKDGEGRVKRIHVIER